MKKKQGFFILTMWWLILPAVIGGLILCFTPDKQRISNRENRVLQNMPDLTLSSFMSGEYSTQFESFLCDSVPGRDSLINISDKILDIISMNTSEDIYYMDTTEEEAANYTSDGESTDETEPQQGTQTDEQSGSEDENSDADTEITAEDDTAVDDKAVFKLIEHDGGSTLVYTYPKKNMTRVAANLEKYAELIPEDGNVYFTTVPFPGLVHRLIYNLDTYCGWESTLTDNMNLLTSDKIKCFNALEILEPHLLAGENLFLFGNHQWNAHGAYYVFSDMISSQGLTPTPFDEYNYRVNRINYDSYDLLYPLAPSKNYRVTNIDRKKEIPFMVYNSATTSSFLYGHIQPWKTVETGFNTGRSALVIGDCFDLAITPFLLPYYDQVHAVDIRYSIFEKEKLGTTVADMMERNSIDDVYIIFSEANDVNSQTLMRYLGENLN